MTNNSEERGPHIKLTGTGAAYIRVSTDQQDTERQYASLRTFTARTGVHIPDTNWFEDQGWARDTADRRPEFQKLLRAAESGTVKWILVDKLDRFGTKNAKQLIAYLNRLDECGCKLFDSDGKEWTGQDIATIITAVVEGEKSRGEQAEKSHRVLSGKIAGAQAGEWQGGYVRLGFDVACYNRETNKEVWRVAFVGKDKRLKSYPDGRIEAFNGPNNFPQSQPLTEVLRVTPSRDRAKIDAAVSVFKRYATESVSFTVLAKYLNGLGFRTCTGSKFQGHHIGPMLEDPIYRGHYTWNKTHHGKFHRYSAGRTVADTNYSEKSTANAKSDWVQSQRLFEPLVDTKTWATVQAKLDSRTIRAKAPTNPSLYLAGLLYCENCGGRMVVGPKRKATKKRGGRSDGRFEYICGTYQRYAAGKNCDDEPKKCPCLRNAVFQDILDASVERYLTETGQRLRLLTGRNEEAGSTRVTDHLATQADTSWEEFGKGIERLESYLATHYPNEYDQLRAREEARIYEEENGATEGPALPPGTLVQRYGEPLVRAANASLVGTRPAKPHGFPAQIIACYRDNFDRAALDAEIGRLDTAHTALTHRYADLPTPRAKEKAAAELRDLEQQIAELERHRGDAAGAVERQYREMLDLQIKVVDARTALQSTTGERALRQRAEAIRQVIQRIVCRFTATGRGNKGAGRPTARLVEVTFYPLVGSAVAFETTAPLSPPAALSHLRAFTSQ